MRVDTRITVRPGALTRLGSLFSARWVLVLVAFALTACQGDARTSEAALVQAAEPLLGIGYSTAFWRFEDCGAGSLLTDSSGNGLSATKSVGVTCVRGHDGAGGKFDGSSGVVQIPDNPAFHLTDALTVSAWIKPTNVQGLRTILVFESGDKQRVRDRSRPSYYSRSEADPASH